MFPNVAALHAAILGEDPRNFVSHFMFEPVPFAFSNDLPSWIRWKTTLANRLQVDLREVVLTGSAAVGYSLNPTKNFKSFDDTSDIDTGIISPYHFEQSWRYLRQLRPAWLSLPAKSKRAIEMHRTNLVFAGTIATDVILALLPFGSVWQVALDDMSRVNPTAGKEVKLRIYKDYDALRSYQAHNIERLRNLLVVRDETGIQEIGTEE